MTYIRRHKVNIFIQLIFLLLFSVNYILAKEQYFSTVTIYPLLVSEITATEGVKISDYRPEITLNLFLKELSKDNFRLDAYKSFLLKNKYQCNDLDIPITKFYQKTDRSFPGVTEHITIEVASDCKNFSNKFIVFLIEHLNETLVNKIQDTENFKLGNQRDRLVSKLERDISDVKNFLSHRKETLKKIIKSSDNKNKTSNSNSNSKTMLNIRGDRSTSVFNVDIPASYEAAEVELNFLSSISNPKAISIDMMNYLSDIERYSVKQNFQGARLIDSSSVSVEKKSKRSLFIYLFLVIITVCIGFLIIALNELRHKRRAG